MRRVAPLWCFLLVLVLLFFAAGCGKPDENKKDKISKPGGSSSVQDSGGSSSSVQDSQASNPSDNAADIEYLKSYIDALKKENSDFDHDQFDRIDFAVDSQGISWALVYVDTYYKSHPSEGMFEAYVFKRSPGGQWVSLGGGSGGFSSKVPPEVQKKWGIEGY